MSRRRTAPQPESEPSSVAARLDAAWRGQYINRPSESKPQRLAVQPGVGGVGAAEHVRCQGAPGGVEAVETLPHRMQHGVYC